ncbi:MAG: phosphotransferase [Fibrobacteres bacterium]|nr:phosphotransferase [Fibrobacterota bacterium]
MTNKLTEDYWTPIIKTLEDTFKVFQVKFIQYSRNAVFQAFYNNAPVILRLKAYSETVKSQILAELEWIEFLSHEGLPVCTAIKVNNEILHEIDFNNEKYCCVVFKKAKGRNIIPTDFGAKYFTAIGALAGKMHSITNHFSATGLKRKKWHESSFLTHELSEFLPEGNERIREITIKLISELKDIPRNMDNYGLIHADMYHNNLFINENDLSLFDFDNCEYGYFANDISTTFHDSSFTYMRKKIKGDLGRACFYGSELKDFQKMLGESFFDGYTKFHSLSNQDIAYLKSFYKLREIVVYVHHNTIWNESKAAEPLRTYLEQDRIQIENGGWEYYLLQD